MLKSQRQKNIIDLLGAEGAVSIAELGERLGVSKMTIRRDLELLEQNGVVRKMHGGAVLVGADASQPSFHERIVECKDEKERIGKAAASLIKPGSIVLLDAGTTPLSVVQYINQDLEFTAITPGLMTAAALCSKPRANVICIGGNIHSSSFSAVSYLAKDMLKNFHADIAFISTKSVHLPVGLFETQLPLIEIKKALVSASDRVVLLADHTKFSAMALCLSIPLSDIHCIITDSGLDPEAEEQLKQTGLEYRLA